MQGQNNEGGNDSADLNFKSSDIQQGDEGQLFVNIEGAEERAAEEAEAKAKIEAEERAKQEAEQRARAAEEHAREAAKQKAEKARLAEEKKLAKKAAGSTGTSKKKKIIIATVAMAAVLLTCGAIFVLLQGQKNTDGDGSEVTSFESDVFMSAVEITKKYDEDPNFGKTEAYAEFDKLIEAATDRDEKFSLQYKKHEFAYSIVQNISEAKSIYEEMCNVDNKTKVEVLNCINLGERYKNETKTE